LVACGWFGIQTWLGGLAFVAIAGVVVGNPDLMDSFPAQFTGFIIFWFINMFFVWKGTESIRVLETLAAPILVLIGVLMLWWGVSNAGGLSNVLNSSNEFSKPAVVLTATGDTLTAKFNLLKDGEGKVRAQKYRSIFYEGDLDEADQKRLKEATYLPLKDNLSFPGTEISKTLAIQFQGVPKIGDKTLNKAIKDGDVSMKGMQAVNSKEVVVPIKTPESSVVSVGVTDGQQGGKTPLMTYLFWLTAMVAFWATLALNIPDITRYAKSQKDQAIGQFLGLPTTMVLYSFIGVAVTCAAIIIFDDLLITADAPWDPIRLLARFDDQPVLLIFAQVGILIATLSTNIAANVISPANSFANLYPEKISFRMGGYITGIIGILIMPWKLLGLIIGFLLTYGAILGPVVGILLADYFIVNKKELALDELYQKDGRYRYANGWNPIALLALGVGVFLVLLGMFIPSLKPLYDTGWFVGFIVSFIIYASLQKKQ
jgi:cytosine/uracil/thiamine/allantoin permease